MLDMRALAEGLDDYRHSMSRHIEIMNAEFESLSRSWDMLDECFAGNAADEFRPIWEGTRQNFREYMEHSQLIIRSLGEKIDDLREADRSMGLSG